jgi:hypothetical protein
VVHPGSAQTVALSVDLAGNLSRPRVNRATVRLRGREAEKRMTVPRVVRLMFWVGLAGVAAVIEACGGSTNDPQTPSSGSGPGGNAGAAGRGTAGGGQSGGPSSGGAAGQGGGATSSGGTGPSDAGLWDVIYE